MSSTLTPNLDLHKEMKKVVFVDEITRYPSVLIMKTTRISDAAASTLPCLKSSYLWERERCIKYAVMDAVKILVEGSGIVPRKYEACIISSEAVPDVDSRQGLISEKILVEVSLVR